MPPSSSDQDQAVQAEATCPPRSFTTTEIIALQVVAPLLKVNLSEMIRLAETRQQNPDAPFPSLNDHVAKPASLVQSPYPTTEPSTESVSCGIAKESTRHTFEDQGDGGYAAIQPEDFNSAAAGFAGEQGWANVLEGKHGLAVIDSVLKDSGGNRSNQIFEADRANISSLQSYEPLDAIPSTTWEGTIDPQLLSAIGNAPEGNPARIQQTAPQVHDNGRFDPYPNAAPQPFLSPVTSAQLASSLLSPGFAPTTNAQFPNNLGNTIPERCGDFTSATSAGTHLAGGANFTDFEDCRLDPEASDHTVAGLNVQVPNLLYQRPATPFTGLNLATQEPETTLGNELSVAEIRDGQSLRTKQRRGQRLTASSSPKSGVRKQRNGLDAAELAMVNAGRLRSCAGSWIQHKKVPAFGFIMV